jgi:hypothetical protein
MPANSAIPFPGSSSEAASIPASDQGAVIAAVQPETPKRILGAGLQDRDPLLTAEDVAQRLNVTKDWVWDHSSRKPPYLPVIRMGLSVIGRAELKSLSTNESASLKSAASARKMGAGPLVPPQKLRNEWVGRIKRVGSSPVERSGTGTFARRYSIRPRISREAMPFR